MKKTSNFVPASLAALSALLLVSGCVVVVDNEKSNRETSSGFEQREADNRAVLSRLAISSSTHQVLDVMGTPDFDEQLTRNNTQYRVLYYRTQRVTADGMTTKDECTPLVFANGSLLGWGANKLALVTGDASVRDD